MITVTKAHQLTLSVTYTIHPQPPNKSKLTLLSHLCLTWCTCFTFWSTHCYSLNFMILLHPRQITFSLNIFQGFGFVRSSSPLPNLMVLYTSVYFLGVFYLYLFIKYNFNTISILLFKIYNLLKWQ